VLVLSAACIFCILIGLFSPLCDRLLAHAPSLSQYRFTVATSEDKIHKKTWNEAFFVVPLHRQSERKQLLSDTKKRI
jgi:hypothetical protein